MKTTVIFVSLGITTAAVFLCPIGTSDLFWQLKTGELIVSDFNWPVLDTFSYTFSGNPWINFEWLSEVVFYLIWRAGGFEGLSVLSLAIGAGISSTLYFGLRRTSSSIIAIILTPAFLFIAAPRLQQLRPELFAFFFFALTIPILLSNRRLWTIPLILALWANFHPSAVIGVVVVLTFVLLTPSSKRDLKSGALLALASLAAPIINPLHLKIYTLPFEIASQDITTRIVSDWSPPSWFVPEAQIMAWGLVAFFILSVFAAIRHRDNLDHRLLAVTLIFSLPAFCAARFVPFAMIAMAFFISSLVPTELQEKKIFLLGLILIPTAFTGVPYSLSISQGRAYLTLGPKIGIGMNKEDFPVEAAGFIEQSNLKGNMLNDMAWGGYLIWRFYPERKVFIDTRTHLYGDAFIKEYSDALFDKQAFERLVDKYNIDLVLYDARQLGMKNSPLHFLDGNANWRVAFTSQNSVVYGRY